MLNHILFMAAVLFMAGSSVFILDAPMMIPIDLNITSTIDILNTTTTTETTTSLITSIETITIPVNETTTIFINVTTTIPFLIDCDGNPIELIVIDNITVLTNQADCIPPSESSEKAVNEQQIVSNNQQTIDAILGLINGND